MLLSAKESLQTWVFIRSQGVGGWKFCECQHFCVSFSMFCFNQIKHLPTCTLFCVLFDILTYCDIHHTKSLKLLTQRCLTLQQICVYVSNASFSWLDSKNTFRNYHNQSILEMYSIGLLKMKLSVYQLRTVLQLDQIRDRKLQLKLLHSIFLGSNLNLNQFYLNQFTLTYMHQCSRYE